MAEFLCCNKRFKHLEERWLKDKNEYVDRRIIWGVCPHCGAVRCELIEYNIITNEIAYDRGKPNNQKKLQQWLKKLLLTDETYQRYDKIKQGSQTRMGFIYGVSSSDEHKGYDFNGTLRKRFKKNNGMA